jgi:hypothetical protein
MRPASAKVIGAHQGNKSAAARKRANITNGTLACLGNILDEDRQKML